MDSAADADLLTLLPWEDVIFRHILPHLRVGALFSLRAVSKQWRACVNSFLQIIRKVHLVNVGTKFTAWHFDILTRESYNVRSLIIRQSNHWLSDDVLLPFIANNSSLERVDLSGSTAITNRIPQCIASRCPNLKEIVLRECHWLSDASVNHIAMHCTGLEKIDVTGCWDVTDVSVSNVATLCTSLKFLSVSKIYGLTDQSISLVAKQLPYLEHLNLQGCWRVSDKSMFLLSEYCKNLKRLQVKECRDISVASVRRLLERGVKVDIMTSSKLKMTAKHYEFMKALPM